MLVFKNSTNPSLIGKDVLAIHPERKMHFDDLMSNQEGTAQKSCKDLNDEFREYLKTGKISRCKNRHCDRSSDDDGDEMDDILADNSNVKGCWVKNKSKM